MKLLSNFTVASLATVALTTFSLSPSFAQMSFSDVDESNVYAEEIQEAVKMGIVKGFPDGTFRPDTNIKREDAVVMVVNAISQVMPINLDERPRKFPPFSDVSDDRPSAKYIYWLQSNIFPANVAQNTGQFRPEEYITRRGLVEFLKWTAEFVSIKNRASAELVATEKPQEFSDVYGPDKVITMQMSAFCNVASPLNETGTKFFPTKPAHRDYVAAAIVRAVNCKAK